MNCGLRGDLLTLVHSTHIHCTVYCTPSHTDTKPNKLKNATQCMQTKHALDSKEAARLSGDATESHCIPVDQAQLVIEVLKHLALIQIRLITVIKLFSQRRHNAKVGPKFALSHSQTSIQCHKAFQPEFSYAQTQN